MWRGDGSATERSGVCRDDIVASASPSGGYQDNIISYINAKKQGITEH